MKLVASVVLLLVPAVALADSVGDLKKAKSAFLAQKKKAENMADVALAELRKADDEYKKKGRQLNEDEIITQAFAERLSKLHAAAHGLKGDYMRLEYHAGIDERLQHRFRGFHLHERANKMADHAAASYNAACKMAQSAAIAFELSARTSVAFQKHLKNLNGGS